MGKALRIQLFKILVLFLALSCSNTFQSLGQVPLVDLRSFEISFTPGESSRERSGVHLSMQEAKRMSGLEKDDGTPFGFTTKPDRQTGFYFVDTLGGASLGRYYHKNDNNILSQLPVRNGTPANISGISLAFDFVYLPAPARPNVSFKLFYRVTNGEWISPSGGTFTSELLQQEGQEWSSFSMQIHLDKLYMLPNDILEIRWVADGVDDVQDFIPIALQKIEMFATAADTKDIHPGSLIISEIMTSFDAGPGNLEYVEVYNSTEDPINLKGLVLHSGNKRVVVQHNLVAEPYAAVVLAGFSKNDRRLETLADYRYAEQLLLENSGRITLTIDGKDIARALYNSQNSGTSIQMRHLENAFDGYSSLSYFVPATEEWNSVLTGTPGYVEPERRLYTKHIERSGWYLLEPPGRLSEITSRDVLSDMISVMTGKTVSGNGEHTSPLVYHHIEAADPVRLYASGESLAGSATKRAGTNQSSDGHSLESIAVQHPSSIKKIVNADGEQAHPALLTWNASNQAFEMVWKENDVLKPWNSYLVSKDKSARQIDRENGANSDGTWRGLARSVELSLVSDNDSASETTEYDRSLIGFWEPVSQNGDNLGFNLPKLWAPLSETGREARNPMIYLKSADNSLPASYLNFPYTPEDNIQVSVGLRLPPAVDRAQIRWDFIESLPERWEIEFVDAEIGEHINMREQESYIFSERSDVVRKGINDPARSFQQVEPEDYNRFYIRISSTGDLEMFENETESPESIELKQNYPNPFNPTTTIGFYLPIATDVRIGVYNVVGQQVGQLVDDRLSAGNHTVSWNALDMPSGVYIVQLEAMNSVQTRKITLIK